MKTEQTEAINTLADIRTIMERSTKFTSFSGLSAILIGIYAIATVAIVFAFFGHFNGGLPELLINSPFKLKVTVIVAIGLLTLALCTVLLLAYRKNKCKIQFDTPLKRLAWSFALPMIVGGALCFSVFINGHYSMTSTLMLVFYGLALVGISTNTYSNVKYLGYIQITLGLIDSFTPGLALLLWTLGFGVSHIVYGIFFYIKYDRSSTK